MEKNLNMTQGKPLKLLITFALPLMFGNIFQQLYTVIDIAIVGQGVGLDALAALGAVDWLNWMLLGAVYGFTQGFSVRIAQKYGAADREGLRQSLGQSAVLCGLLSVALVMIAQVFLPQFLDILRVKPQLRHMSELYVRILMAGLPIVMFFNFCSGTLRAIGDSKTPLYAMIAASVTNIVLDCLTVFVFGWGIAGAAISTIIAQCLSGVICAVRMVKNPALRFQKRDMRLQKQESWGLLKLGSPLAAKNIIIAMGGIAIQSIVNGFSLGFIAGFTATNKLYGLLEIAALSYGYAITTYVGQNYGAGKHTRIRQGVRSAIGISLVTAVIISAVMLLFGHQITGIFISREDPALAAVAAETAYIYLCFMSCALPALYLLYVFLSALQGIGKTVSTMISGILELLIRVCLSLVIAKTGYEIGICGAEVAAWIGGATYLAISYFYYAKRILPRENTSTQ